MATQEHPAQEKVPFLFRLKFEEPVVSQSRELLVKLSYLLGICSFRFSVQFQVVFYFSFHILISYLWSIWPLIFLKHIDVFIWNMWMCLLWKSSYIKQMNVFTVKDVRRRFRTVINCWPPSSTAEPVEIEGGRYLLSVPDVEGRKCVKNFKLFDCPYNWSEKTVGISFITCQGTEVPFCEAGFAGRPHHFPHDTNTIWKGWKMWRTGLQFCKFWKKEDLFQKSCEHGKTMTTEPF